MAVPIIFSPVLKQDFKLNPIQVHKQFVIDSASYVTTESGYRKWDALYLGEKMKLGSSTYPTNSDNTYKHIIWNQIDSLYYRFPYDTCATLEHSNQRFTYKFLGISASVLSIPQQKFGETIKPGSVQITSSGNTIVLADDGNGNLYDISISTSSFLNRENLVAFWAVNEEYKKFRYQDNAILTGNIKYQSRTFTPDNESFGKNFTISSTVNNIANTGSRNLGERLWFSLDYFNYQDVSFIRTDDRRELNFATNEDFTIAFWMSTSDFTSGSLLTKNGVIRKQLFGDVQLQKDTATIQSTHEYSQSYVDQYNPVYPYDFTVTDSGLIRFKRSDGITTLHLSSSNFTNDGFRHVCVTKSGSLCTLYVDGVNKDSGTDRTLNPINTHCLMFGSRFQSSADGALTFLSDVRIYNKAFPQSSIQTLATSQSLQMNQTAVVGNVFYRTGNIVITSDNPIYREILTNPSIRFKSTHTIYEYECLVRIKKGSYNLTQNPTSKQTPNSDLLLNDFTGSLFPYATSIGLYNDTGELMAVAKLAQPLQMRDDVDMNIAIRFDA